MYVDCESQKKHEKSDIAWMKESLRLDVDGNFGKPNDESFHVMQEAAILLNLALPSVLVQLCMYFIFPQAASVVGRQIGTEALAGFSLGSLLGNLTCLSIMIGALTAADTLMPRAFGRKDFRTLGILVIQSVTVCSGLLLLPLIPLVTCTDWVLVHWLGQDVIASRLAAEWIRVYVWGIPANMLFRVLQRFLVAQQRPWPPVYASAIPGLLLQPLFVAYFVPTMGFIGSALSVVITQWCMLGILLFLLYWKPEHHPDSWPGLSWPVLQEALKPKSLRRFWSLSLGGVVSLSVGNRDRLAIMGGEIPLIIFFSFPVSPQKLFLSVKLNRRNGGFGKPCVLWLEHLVSKPSVHIQLPTI